MSHVGLTPVCTEIREEKEESWKHVGRMFFVGPTLSHRTEAAIPTRNAPSPLGRKSGGASKTTITR